MPAALCLTVLIALSASSSPAAEAGVETVTVTGRALQEEALQSSRQDIGAAALQTRAAFSLAEALELGASANITVNSRGETLVYLRNSGERQVAVIFDGALINLPWDNRLSLDLLPASALSGVALTPGAASVRHGVNSAGGSIEVLPAGPEAEGLRLAGATGAEETLSGSAAWLGLRGETSLLVASDHFQRDALRASGGGRLPNTDQTRNSLLIRLAQEGEDAGAYSLALLHVDSAYGVAPEAFDRPAQGRPRYWRYPDTRQTIAVARLAQRFGGVTLNGSLWRLEAGQAVDSYASAAYAQRQERLDQDDVSTGLRIEAASALGDGVLHLGLSGLASRHDERETVFSASPASVAARFSDRRGSLFAEYETRLGEVDLAFGVSHDRLDPRETGGRPDRNGFAGTNWTAAAGWSADASWRFRLAASRKHRLPTLRELYGTALGRFAPNPALRPERIDMLEASAIWTGRAARLEITPFASRTAATIDQRTLLQGGETLRQRVNLRGSEIHGVEVLGEARLGEVWTLSGHVFASRPRRRPEAGETGPLFLSERPELIARLALDRALPGGIEAGLELQHRGRAWSFTDEAVFEPLARSTELNLRAAWAPEERGWLVWARLDNATDELVEPQLGLFAAGRSWRLGLSKAF